MEEAPTTTFTLMLDPSGRAGCKAPGCGEKIVKGTPRVTKEFEAQDHPMCHHFHTFCFFTRAMPTARSWYFGAFPCFARERAAEVGGPRGAESSFLLSALHAFAPFRSFLSLTPTPTPTPQPLISPSTDAASALAG
jgi:hypothetical protein